MLKKRGRTFGRRNIERRHLGDGKLGYNVKTEDWAKDPEIGRKCIKWKIGRKNKNLKQTEFE